MLSTLSVSYMWTARLGECSEAGVPRNPRIFLQNPSDQNSLGNPDRSKGVKHPAGAAPEAHPLRLRCEHAHDGLGLLCGVRVGQDPQALSVAEAEAIRAQAHSWKTKKTQERNSRLDCIALHCIALYRKGRGATVR